MDRAELDDFCRSTWGQIPDAVEKPGGPRRKTVVVRIGEDCFVVSKRNSSSRARLEAAALDSFSGTGQVPRLVLQDKEWVVQERIVGERLSLRMEMAEADGRRNLMIAASRGLISLQQAGTATALLEIAPRIGARPGWFEDFARLPTHLADRMGIVIDDYDGSLIAPSLQGETRVFVKWDARPGNALVTKNDKLVWFDWEHCGTGSPEDDLVWFFADEATPTDEPATRVAIAYAADVFGLEHTKLETRFLRKAVLHSIQRLLLILDRKGNGSWWSVREIMERDHVGVTPAHVRRLCVRATAWTRLLPEMQPLIPLFDGTLAKLNV